MSCDNVRYEGHFRDPQGRYSEIRDTLIQDFIELGLEPDEGFWSDDIDGWRTLFEIKNGYMELEIYNCFGNYGYAMEYLEQKLPKKFPDIQFEFLITVDDPEYRGGDKIIYDGKTIKHEEFGVSFDEPCEELELVCPNCGSFLRLCCESLYCDECDTEFFQEDLEDIDLDEVKDDIMVQALSTYDEKAKFKLVN